MTRSARRATIFAAGLVVAAGALIAVIVLAGGGHSTSPPGLGVDLAFAREMIPHHRDAVDMTQIAEKKTDRAEVRKLAQDIITTQTQEIGQLQAIDQRLVADGVTPASLSGSEGHSTATGTADSAHDPSAPVDLDALRNADPFDQAFIDEMIPHHQAAIVMAREVLARGTDPEVARIASAVITAQSKEIQQMNTWRRAWYGSESPAGGVPA